MIDKIRRIRRAQKSPWIAEVRAREQLERISEEGTRRSERRVSAMEQRKLLFERAASFKHKQEVWVDGISGTGTVTEVDAVRRGVVFVKYPRMPAVSYSADRVHALEEKETEALSESNE